MLLCFPFWAASKQLSSVGVNRGPAATPGESLRVWFVARGWFGEDVPFRLSDFGFLLMQVHKPFCQTPHQFLEGTAILQVISDQGCLLLSVCGTLGSGGGRCTVGACAPEIGSESVCGAG